MEECKVVYKLTTEVVFPEGVSPGAGGDSNKQIIARNGKNEPVLRGTALAGVIRHAYAERLHVKSMDDEVVKWFGGALDGNIEKESKIHIADSIINCKTVTERTHNMINRHTGAAVKGALFTLEAVPPRATAHISLTVKPNAETDKSNEDFITTLMTILGNGIIVGGSSNRGIGRMMIDDGFYVRTFDLDTVDGVADFWDAEYTEHRDGVQCSGEKIKPVASVDCLTISLKLGIPRGEDLLIGDGQEIDYALQPQKVFFADGTEHWRIPGSSFRGVFRAWMTRLASKENENAKNQVENEEKLIDSIEKYTEYVNNENLSEYKAELIGWGFKEGKERKAIQLNPAKLNDPILDLFGSMYKKGRIHFTDSFTEKAVQDSDVQDRMHVAIDRFSGGTNEGALFNNQVLVGNTLIFPITIIIEKAKSDEVRWLVKTLRAIHLGILLVGSSKSSGCLEINNIKAEGQNSELINLFAEEITNG